MKLTLTIHEAQQMLKQQLINNGTIIGARIDVEILISEQEPTKQKILTSKRMQEDLALVSQLQIHTEAYKDSLIDYETMNKNISNDVLNYFHVHYSNP